MYMHTYAHTDIFFLTFVKPPFKNSVKCSAFKVTLYQCLTHPALLFTWYCVVPLPCSHQLELIFTIFETSS